MVIGVGAEIGMKSTTFDCDDFVGDCFGDQKMTPKTKSDPLIPSTIPSTPSQTTNKE